MANSDCIVIQGSNMAENHPVGYQWVTEAKARGAKVIHVDPRFTRTSAVADRHIALRAGSDVALLGALINYVLDNDLWFKDYVLNYTNAPIIVNEKFRDTEDLEGLFSGYNPETGQYEMDSWAYQHRSGEKMESEGEGGRSGDEQSKRGRAEVAGAGGPTIGSWRYDLDPTLQHPRTVFQILKRHYSRYTPEMVEETCGISREDFNYLARTITENSGRERTTCFAYALGWTQHTLGAQFIRTASILQLLLGNIGRPGGGVMALRGHASIQGSTDIPTLYDLLPGYLPMPSVDAQSLDKYLDNVRSTDQKGFWHNAPDYMVSLLKAWYGDYATEDNDWGFNFIPKITGHHDTYHTVEGMMRGEVDGYFVFGQNPAVGSANGKFQRMGLSRLKWLVVRDFQQIETATFWKDGPEIETGELVTEEIDTEVFFMSAANHVEKAGTFTQTQRMLQWRHQAVQPPGQATSELEFFHKLGNRLREKVADSTDPRDLPLQAITWDYPTDEHGDPDAEAVLAEINGYHVTGDKAGQPLSAYGEMKADGSTAGGCWIYTGVYADGVNQAARRAPGREQNDVALEWGWAWPANRRILYNRASADPQGKPWSERKKYVWWSDEDGKWISADNVDFPPNLHPDHRPEENDVGVAALSGNDPFIMQSDGKGWLYAPNGTVDGPLPTHYEPQESPVANPVYKQQASPARITLPREDNLSAPSAGAPGAEVYPYIFTTYRLTEHHTAGGMSRWLPYLSELQPEMFCEISPELADEHGLEDYGWATIISPRSAIEVKCLVTERVKPLTIAGETFHQIGLPYHWANGGNAVVEGDAANDLLGVTLDPNIQIQESKVGSCAIIPGRRPRGEALTRLVKEYQERAGLTTETGNKLLTMEDAFTQTVKDDNEEDIDDDGGKEE